MTALLVDAVLDGALNIIKNNVTQLFIVKTAQPTDYASASGANKLGTKATPTFTGPADDTSGRKLTIDAITDGTVSADGTAAYIALCSADTLYAAYELNATQAVTNGNTFSLTAFKIAIPDPTA